MRQCVAGIVALVFSAGVFAAPIFNVNSTADAADDSPGDGICHTIAGPCTLRAAIMEANRASGIGATINLPAGTYTLLIPASASDDEASGDLNLATPISGDPLITILGAGAATTIIDANQIDRVMQVEALRSAYLHGVTLRGGYNTQSGGGLLNRGTLALDRVDIAQNTAHDGGGISNIGQLTLDHVNIGPHNQSDVYGGGISNSGTLMQSDSSVFANQSGFGGGGLANFADATITRSTFSLNRSEAYGGGIENSGNLSIDEVTIANNHTQIAGGGIVTINSSSDLTIYDSTVTGNSAYADDGSDGTGGGITIYAGIVTVRNSLLAGNYYNGYPDALEDCYTDGSAILHTSGANLFTAASHCTVEAGGGGWDPLNSLDYLGSLKNNGGPTQTIALLSGSNAIDDGFACVDTHDNTVSTDQRGFARVVGSACDIGAYEFDPDRIFTNGFEH